MEARRATPSVPPGHDAARADVIEATRALEAAARRRDAAADALRRHLGSPCGPVLERAAATVAAWDALGAAWARYGSQAGTDARRDRAAQAQRDLAVQRTLAHRYQAAWTDWCATRPAWAPPEPALPRAVARCGAVQVRGAIVNLVAGEATALRGPADTAAALEAVGAHVDADWTLALVFDERLPTASEGDRATLRIAGRAGPEGADPAHLPGWPALEGAAVYPAAGQLDQAAVLRGILRVYGNRWAYPGCGQDPRPGWGASDVGGQLGGAQPGGIEALGAGQWRLTGPGGRPAGQVANGGDAVGYAPIERYLLGLADAAEVPPITALRRPRWIAAGRVASTGTCQLDLATLRGAEAAPPRREGPWRVGVVVRTARPLAHSELARWAEALHSFATPGPDDQPFRMNFHEATGGRGRLQPTRATVRAACEGGRPAVPSGP